MRCIERRRGTTTPAEIVEARLHLHRFLLWLGAAAAAFGALDLASAAVLHSWQLATIGAVDLGLVPIAILGRRALERERPEVAVGATIGGLLFVASVATVLLPQLDVIDIVAVMAVLVAVPLVRQELLRRVFVTILVWAVAMATAQIFLQEPASVPDWFANSLNVSILAIATPLALFLLRNFHRRLSGLLAAARAAETQYRTLVEQLPAVTFVDIVSPGDPFRIEPLYVSPQIETILGYPADRWITDAQLWRSILHPEDRARAIELSERVYEAREPYTVEYRLVAADGRIVWIEEASVIIPGVDGDPTIWQGVMFDVTARREAEEERVRGTELLRRADAQRRELLADLVAAQEAERKRLATEIHDDPVQKMTAVGLRLGFLLRTLTDAEQIRIVEQLQSTVEVTIARLRGLMFELRPPALDRGGLVAAVRDLISEMADTFPRSRIDDQLAREPGEEIRTVAYRIVAEALANVQRHSRASDVQIAFFERDGGLLVRIRDDGVGISSETLTQGRPGHLGLTSMRERAEAAGGWTRVEKNAAGGTLVEAWLPMGGADADGDATPGANAAAVRSA
jgi:PAS domain S-box-containing protein